VPALPFIPTLLDTADEEDKFCFTWVSVMKWAFEHNHFCSVLAFRQRRLE